MMKTTLASLATFLVLVTVPLSAQAVLVGTVVCVPIVGASNFETRDFSNCGGSLSAVEGDCLDGDAVAWAVTLGYRTGSGTAEISAQCGGTVVAHCQTTARNSPCTDEGDAVSGLMECNLYVFSGTPDDFFGGCEDPVNLRYVQATIIDLTNTDPSDAGEAVGAVMECVSSDDPFAFLGACEDSVSLPDAQTTISDLTGL